MTRAFRIVAAACVVLCAVAFGQAPQKDTGRFPRFDEWFRRYRDGRVVFFLRGGRVSAGAEIDSFAPESPFQRALSECVRSQSIAGADRLLELVSFRFADSATKELEEFASQAPDRVREEGLNSLAKMRNPEVLTYLAREVLLDRNKSAPAKRAAAAQAIGLARDAQHALALYSASSDSAPEVRAAVVAAATELGDVRGSLLSRWFADSDPSVRILVLGAAQQSLAKVTDAAERFVILDAVRQRLEDQDWRVRERAVEVLAAYPAIESIPALIQSLVNEKQRLQEKTGRKRLFERNLEALTEITGLEIPADPARWSVWWDRNKDKFQLGDHHAGRPRTRADATDYFRIAIKSDRLVFVIDVSGSMNEPYSMGGRAPTSANPSRSVDATKLDRVKSELNRVIQQLGEDDKFQIVSFSNHAKAAFPKLLAATKDNKRAAERWVNNLAAVGGTALWDGLETALHFSGSPDPTSGRDADTIFLLTDGEPTAGALIEPPDILRGIQKTNKTARIVLNTIFVGPEESIGAQLLSQLAKENGGEYRRAAEKP